MHFKFQALQIILGAHAKLNSLPASYSEGWSPEDRSKAMNFQKCLCTFGIEEKCSIKSLRLRDFGHVD